ncbi:hypothetical protein PVL30_000035 [Lodderomyces elongisporus]|uniref:Uncharacterized protein n=1 Tax=Lodderomyces elongisporus (strain ATCC 11503 / CBS 2605 / JCM 1781 / NBRC 1676 / NRRL YB-4239) TaxID=379508 RepID=A5H2R2_LODEL|nr:uncharacterized protein PVL30_000035 [Lodderomyces elongisporus]EDK47596.1 hypothetical protein LELG_05777 [Lodderomyces elongisporus NRRL YB-4239]WLF76334.1 hypothetical protein PVL30_000035 [Lodderomyces elongisporus]
MSDQVNKVAEKVKQKVPTTSKKFDSKALHHINQYSLVQYLQHLTLSFSLFKAIYEQFVLPLYSFITVNLLSISPIYDVATFADSLTNASLSIFDKYAIDLPLQTSNTIEKQYIKPVNKRIIEVNNKYLTPLKEEGEDGVFQIYYTVKSILYNLTSSAFSKSTEIQKNIVDTYNQELKSTPPQQNVIGKNIQATYSTSIKTIKTLNDDYLTPLKNQTHEIVANGQKKAESLINNTKEKYVEPKLNELNQKKDDLLNGNAPAVSASA